MKKNKKNISTLQPKNSNKKTKLIIIKKNLIGHYKFEEKIIDDNKINDLLNKK